MGIQSRAAFKHLKRSLLNAARLPFQRECFELLRHGWPELTYAYELGRHDRRGADLFSFGCVPPAGARDYSLVVQCKGIEEQALARKDIDSGLADIRKFRASGKTTDTYWLLFNRPVDKLAFRSELESSLVSLVQAEVVEHARWLDPDAMLRLLFERLRERLTSRLAATNTAYLRKYDEVMRSNRPQQYVSDVPFVTTLRSPRPPREWRSETFGRNPMAALIASLPERADDPDSKAAASNEKALRIVVSEFGFGKTLLLMELAQALGRSGRTVLYRPIAEVDADAFTNEATLARSLYESLWPEDELPLKVTTYPPLASFREIIRYDPRTLLLLDGLDEHHACYTLEGLTRVFACLRELACDIVVSVRKEFYDSYKGNLDHALAGVASDCRLVSLQEWDDGTILQFLANCDDSPGLRRLEDAVKSGHFEGVFGDIPRRPLFLEMLAEELEEDRDCSQNLAALYQRFLLRKMERDLMAPFRAGVRGGGRPVPHEHVDVAAWRERLLRLLARLAWRTLQVVEGAKEMVFSEDITEEEVLTEAEGVRLRDAEIVPLLQHSLLVTRAPRSARGTLRLRFAHRSFQEFFAARWYADFEGRDALSRDPPLPIGVRRFVLQMLNHGRC